MSAAPANTRFVNDMKLSEVWVPFLVWLMVSVVTLGLGWIIVSGHFFKLVVNQTRLIDAEGATIGRLVCDYDVEREMRLVVIWLIVCIATCGVGLLFYSFHAARAVLNATEIAWETASA